MFTLTVENQRQANVLPLRCTSTFALIFMESCLLDNVYARLKHQNTAQPEPGGGWDALVVVESLYTGSLVTALPIFELFLPTIV